MGFRFEEIFRRPDVYDFGGGVDSASNLYFSSKGVTASGHNFWIETLFRIGVFGVLINILPYILIYFIMKYYRVREDYKSIYVVVLFL